MTSGSLAVSAWAVAVVLLTLAVPLGTAYEAVAGDAARARLRSLTAGWLRFFFVRFLPFIRLYRLKELPTGYPDGPALLVSNHRSWLDALLLIGLYDKVKVPVSIRYARLPLIGSLIRWLGCACLDSRDLASTASSLKRLAEELRSGAVIAAFPEGRRMGSGELALFSDVFFRLAQDSAAPVYPLVMHSSPAFLGPLTTFHIGETAPRFSLRLGPPIAPDPRDRPADLARLARKWIATELASLEKKDAPKP